MEISKEEADWILGWLALLNTVYSEMGYAPQEKEFLQRMEKYADE